MEGDVNKNTEVVKFRYLHLTRIKNTVYLQTCGWSKCGQATPTEQHNKIKIRKMGPVGAVAEDL